MSSDKGATKAILGTMTFGDQVDEKTAEKMLNLFVERGGVEVDTAFKYAEGRTEEILGKIITPSLRQKVLIATKANPQSEAGFKPEGVMKQVEISLKRMNCDYADLLYLHFPDLGIPIETTLEACQKLYEQGKIKTLGLSNYAAWQVVDIRHICKNKSWVKPVVYQGMYNALTRDVDRELMPALRSTGMSFYAYNPLAGGLLTGKHIPKEAPSQNTRFTVMPFYQDRYWKDTYFQSIDAAKKACEKEGLPMTEGALRWLKHHSMLDGGQNDGIIIGASKMEQLEMNLSIVFEGGPLPQSVVDTFDEAWEAACPVCPRYFRT